MLLPLCGVGAQTINSSPYSRYAFGDLYLNTNAYYFGGGSLFIPSVSVAQVNFGNPASYAYISGYNRHKSVYSVGTRAKFFEFNTESESLNSNAIGLSDFALGFPVGKKGGAAFGLMPYSTVGYDIVDARSDDNAGSYNNVYDGKGGINRVFLGVSRKLLDQPRQMDSIVKDSLVQHETSLSLGANAYYLFGTYTNNRSVEFDDFTYLSTRDQSSTQVSDFMFDAGLYYDYRFKDRKVWVNKEEVRADSTVKKKYEKRRVVFSLGGTVSLANNVNARRDNFIYTYRSNFSSAVEDTIAYSEAENGSLTLPLNYGFGMALSYHKIRIGAQLQMQDWSTYEERFGDDAVTNVLGPSYQGSFGFEIQPQSDFNNQSYNAFELGVYKVGLRYYQTPLSINNTSLTEIGMSFGASFPMRFSGSGSSLNFGVELGERGTTDNQLIQERFVSLRVGLTITPGRFDNWFYQRKYN